MGRHREVGRKFHIILWEALTHFLAFILNFSPHRDLLLYYFLSWQIVVCLLFDFASTSNHICYYTVKIVNNKSISMLSYYTRFSFLILNVLQA